MELNFFSETEKKIYFGICRPKENDLRSILFLKAKTLQFIRKDVLDPTKVCQTESIVYSRLAGGSSLNDYGGKCVTMFS